MPSLAVCCLCRLCLGTAHRLHLPASMALPTFAALCSRWLSVCFLLFLSCIEYTLVLSSCCWVADPLRVHQGIGSSVKLSPSVWSCTLRVCCAACLAHRIAVLGFCISNSEFCALPLYLTKKFQNHSNWTGKGDLLASLRNLKACWFAQPLKSCPWPLFFWSSGFDSPMCVFITS